MQRKHSLANENTDFNGLAFFFFLIINKIRSFGKNQRSYTDMKVEMLIPGLLQPMDERTTDENANKHIKVKTTNLSILSKDKGLKAAN